jgi:hypothetical protein
MVYPNGWKARLTLPKIAASVGRVAIVDGGGNLWLSNAGSCGWERIATNLPYAFGVLIV